MKPQVNNDFNSSPAFAIYNRNKNSQTQIGRKKKSKKKKPEQFSNLIDSVKTTKKRQQQALGEGKQAPKSPKRAKEKIEKEETSLEEEVATKNVSLKNSKKEKPKKDSKTIKQNLEELYSSSDESVPMLVPIENVKNAISTMPVKNVNVFSAVNPANEAIQILEWLINPMETSVFFKKFWEKKPLHIERTNRSYHKHILSSSDLDQMLRNNNLHFSRNVDVVAYEKGVKEVFNVEGRATATAIWDYYTNGCSIRILNPQTYNHKIHLLLVTLQEYFGSMVGANVYLTPPGSQGFAPHYDDIEAFVIQLEGRKHWKLYEPKNQDVLARFSSPNLNHKDIGEPFAELTLNAGEVLYFPRGTIHEGCTDADSHSLHITVSVYQQTSYADLLQNLLPDALTKAAENDVEFRKGLPIDYLKNFGLASTSTKLKAAVQGHVKKLLHSLVDHCDIDAAVDLLGKKLIRDSLPPILSKDEAKCSSKAGGAYLDGGVVKNRQMINLDSRVRLLRYYCMRLVQEKKDLIKLYYCTDNATVYHGEEEQWLEIDSELVPAITMLQKVYPSYIAVEKLPLENALKLQLISDLWEHGLVVVESA